MATLALQVQTYLQIYDPLGMGELAPPEELYGPVVAEIIEGLAKVQTPEEAAMLVHQVLFLTYGTQAGHVHHYAELGRDLFRLVREGR